MPVKGAFPCLLSALQIATTVGTLSENFSSRKRLKTYLRQAKRETRLNSLAILIIDRALGIEKATSSVDLPLLIDLED